MTAVMNQSEMIETVQAARVHPAALGPAIDSKPLVGSEVTIKLALSPAMITLIVAPATVLVTMLAGWIILTSFAIPVHIPEMIAGGIVNAVGGMLAAIPLFLLMKRGAQAIAQAALLGIAVRCAAILMGLIMALGPGWGLGHMILAYWILGYYFPLLIVETSIVGWLCHKANR